MLARAVYRASAASARSLHISASLRAAAAAPTGAAPATAKQGYEAMEIAPTTVPGREYKNEYYAKRGYKLADKSWTEWSDLPAPYKYLGVKVDPKDVEGAGGLLWSVMSDWKLAVPLALIVAMPLYITGSFPGLDERMELGLIILMSGTVIMKEVKPIVVNMIKAGRETRVKALYEAEKALNDEIDGVIAAYSNGKAIPETMKTVHAGERALRAIEAKAASVKAHISSRDAVVAQLDYLVALRGQAAGAAEGAVLQVARASVESALEKDAAFQAKSVDAAIKALKEGVIAPADDIIAPAFAAAVAKATKDFASRPSANPFTNAQQVDMFAKRFGFDAAGGRPVGTATVKSPLAYLRK